MAYQIGPALKEFLESGVAVLVGSGDMAGRPQVAYGWGPRVAEDGLTVDVFLDTARAARTLVNVQATRQVAVTVAHPVSYRSVQLKGTFRDWGEASEQDRTWVGRHREAFHVSTSLVGDPPGAIENLWMDDVVRLSFTVERAFDQTPGPEAGKPL
jgi:hypothetical protein